MLTRNSDIIKTSPYDTAFIGAGNFGTAGQTAIEFVVVGQKYRIRQSTPITKVRFYLATLSNVTAIYIKVSRKMGTIPGGVSSYDRKYKSENILPICSVGLNTYDLNTATMDIQEGDIVGMRIEVSVATANILSVRTGQTNVNTYYKTGAEPGVTSFAWESQTLLAGTAPVIETYGQACDIIAIGDSLAVGAMDHNAYTNTNDFQSRPGYSPIAQLANIISAETGYLPTYQNMGIGGETSTQVEARFVADCRDLAPRYADITVGMNDLATGVSKATYLAKMTSILDMCAAATVPIVPIVNLISPNNTLSNAQMQDRDDRNISLRALCAAYPMAKVVDPNPRVGQFRSGGDPGNLWDVKTGLHSGNGSHLNHAGYYLWARAKADIILQPACRRRGL